MVVYSSSFSFGGSLVPVWGCFCLLLEKWCSSCTNACQAAFVRLYKSQESFHNLCADIVLTFLEIS